jgi:hypothetical protein
MNHDKTKTDTDEAIANRDIEAGKMMERERVKRVVGLWQIGSIDIEQMIVQIVYPKEDGQ